MVLLALLSPECLLGQALPRYLGPILSQEIQNSAVVEFELRQYLTRSIPKLTVPASSREWTLEAERLRKHLLDEVIFHGWPRAWVDQPAKFEDLGLVEPASQKPYRMRKLRYEIVPGFHATAILYEPINVTGKAPAVLNVNGHDAAGKAAEYKQKRCINYALRGMFALSLEWMGFGELSNPENGHDFGAHLDLVGAHSAGLFYLAMRRGLDYLWDHPGVDHSRVGVTGLSGGGWQTIVLSALDERVAVAVPVAGYGSLESNIVHPEDTSQIEEDGTDFRSGQDYTHLTAMRAPRPTLLIYNADDDCCFRAPMVRSTVYDAVKPFFRLFDREDVFAWHENYDPGTHNYQLENRRLSYAFFSKHFHLHPVEDEISVDAEVRSPEELAVGLPKDNLTILGLARKMAATIKRPSEPTTARRAVLRSVVRYTPSRVQQVWMVSNSRNKGVETRSYRFGLSDGLSSAGVWLKGITSPSDAPVTVMLHDEGKKELKEEVADRISTVASRYSLSICYSQAMPALRSRALQTMLCCLLRLARDQSGLRPRN